MGFLSAKNGRRGKEISIALLVQSFDPLRVGGGWGCGDDFGFDRFTGA